MVSEPTLTHLPQEQSADVTLVVIVQTVNYRSVKALQEVSISLSKKKKKLLLQNYITCDTDPLFVGSN